MRHKRLAREAAIGRPIGEHANRYKVRKHFAIHVTADRLACERNHDSIEAKARLDGLYAIRISLPEPGRHGRRGGLQESLRRRAGLARARIICGSARCTSTARTTCSAMPSNCSESIRIRLFP